MADLPTSSPSTAAERSTPMDDGLPVGLPSNPHAVFLSDVHLKEPEDDNYRRMMRLLGALKGLPDLFILGDFFDFWFGFTKVVPARYVPVLARLGDLADSGTRIHFVEGNHDFSMGDYFTRTLGATVHPEWAEAVVAGRRLYLAHGDLVDRNDIGYLRLRKILRSRPVTWLANVVPPRAVLRVADLLDQSAGSDMVGGGHLPGLFREFARARWRDGYDGVMLGHCHVPELLEERYEGRPCMYANLGDWIGNDTFVTLCREGFSLRRWR